MKNTGSMFKKAVVGKFYLSLFVLIFSNVCFASEISKVSYLSKDMIKTGSVLTLLDDSYTEEVTPPNTTPVYAVVRKNRIRLTYNRENKTDLAATWYLIVEYKIYPTGNVSLADTGSVRVRYASGSATSVYESVKEHIGAGGKGYADATVEITNVIPGGAVPSDIRLELITVTERYMNLNTALVPTIFYNPSRSELGWTFVPGAEEYDVEYTFIDDKDIRPSFLGDEKPFEYRAPVRVTTSNQHYVLDGVYPKGIIYFRVRAVGRHIYDVGTDYTHINTGDWGYKYYTVTVSKTIAASFESNKNWIYKGTFAEEGKSNKSIAYADGKGRSRQSQALMNSDNTTIVSENKFDVEGRPVITMLPVPIENTDLTQLFKYKSKFNKDLLGNEYTAAAIKVAADPFGTDGGVGQYYSSENPFKNKTTTAPYIDVAGGYPFTQVVYTRDNTGRVSQATAGAGATYKIGGDHESKYYYSTANSTELHRMFGTNVGVATHYKKNFVMDANGQISTSYLDQEGRVIATALTGKSPDNLTQLRENIETEITVSLKDNNYIDQAKHTSTILTPITNASAIPINYTFNYDMKGVIYGKDITIPAVYFYDDVTQVSDICKSAVVAPICASCTYNLKIKITDPDGLTVPIPDGASSTQELTRHFSNPDNANCLYNQYDQDGVSFILSFSKIGTYTVSKTLSIDDSGLGSELNAALTAAGLTESYKNDLLTCYNTYTDFKQCDVTCVDCHTDQIIAQNTFGCDGMLMQLKEDVKPGGYEHDQPLTSQETGTDNTFWTRVQGEMDEYTLPAVPAEPTQSDLDNPAYIIFLDSDNKVIRPQPTLQQLKDPDYWKTPDANPNQWASQLVKVHREYCHYKRCIQLQASKAFDVKMASVPDWTTAKAKGYLDPMAMSVSTGGPFTFFEFPANVGTAVTNDVVVDYLLSGVDPIFSEKDAHSECSQWNQMAGQLLNSFNDDLGHTDLWNYVFNPNSKLYKAPEPDLVYNDENKWRIFRGIYLNEKMKWDADVSNSIFCNNCPYFTDGTIKKPTSTPEGTEEEIKDAYDMSNDCGDKAVINTMYWMDKLEHYVDSTNCSNCTSPGCKPWDNLTDAQKIDLKHNLMMYSQAHCGISNPFGYILQSLLIPGITNQYLLNIRTILATVNCGGGIYYLSAGDPYTINCPTGNSQPIKGTKVTPAFEQLVNFINELSTKSNGCYAIDNVTYPLIQSNFSGATHLSVNDGAVQLSNSSTCTPSTCQNHILRFYREDGSPVFIEHMSSISLPVHVISSGVPSALPVGEFKNIQCIVSSTKLINSAVEGPILAYLYESGISTTCTAFPLTQAVLLDDPLCSVTLTNEFPVVTKTFDEIKQECIDRLIAHNKILAEIKFLQQVQAFTSEYLNAHYANCFSDKLEESFNYKYMSNEYHYTLYYYDQAGNLTQTVPPEGVDLIDKGHFPGGIYDGTEPVHTYRTRYTYNSLNQVVTQQSPDGGLAHFYYDSEGRLRFSQNAKQLAAGTYSYTQYDGLSRIIQIGESSKPGFLVQLENNAFPDSDLREVTVTTYDGASGGSSITSRFKNGQQYLRSRVAGMVYHEDKYPGITSAAHYSYDEHGNVNELLQVNPTLSLTGTENDNAYKYMRYSYDLISGNVKEVAYQPGKVDAFYHRYRYDADNRLTIAMTSSDQVIWEKDAKYFYYKHGPVSRTELGEDKVQGVDYAYMVNGWLKGINSSTMDVSRDMGKDAYTTGTGINSNHFIAKDALGYSLGYYSNDYTPVVSTTTAQAWLANTVGLSTGASRNLYDGNIANTTSVFANGAGGAVDIQGKAYTYDQLSRIKTATSWSSNLIASNNNFSGAVNDGSFSEIFSYDQNGNIKTVERWGHDASKKMDNFEYHYGSDNNKLLYVQDQGLGILANNYTDDIDDQAATNYDYDQIGNLKQDEQEGIKTIRWNVYGKITSIERYPGSTKVDLEYKYDASGNRICKIVKPRDESAQKTENDWIYTYYVRDAQGNVMAIYERKVIEEGGLVKDRLNLQEHHLYGSNHLGIERKNTSLGSFSFAYTGLNLEENIQGKPVGSFKRPHSADVIAASAITQPIRFVANKSYELSNHLGNVMVVVSDKKLGVDADNAGTEKQAEHYTADILSAHDYYAFGAVMGGDRKVSSSLKYRYGFNGKENDNEVKDVEGSQQDYGMRIYDPRLGKFLSEDPITSEYPELTPYQFAGNKPINSIDLDGLEPWEVSKTTTIPESSSSGTYIHGEYTEPTSTTTTSFSGTVYGPYVNAEAATSAAASGSATIANYHQTYTRTFEACASDGYLLAQRVDYGETYATAYTIGQPLFIGEGSGAYSRFGTHRSITLDRRASGACSPTGVLDPLIDGIITQPLAGGLEYLGMSESASQYTAGGITFAGMLAIGTKGKGFQNHHIIPNAVYRDFKADFKAMGWKQNDIMNLKKLPTPFHGNHPAYNRFLRNEVLMLKKTGTFDRNSMQNLQFQMRLKIGDAYRSGGTLNEYFKN